MVRRKLNDVEWADCSKVSQHYEGISVGIKHLGPGVVSKWMLMRERWEIEDRRRRSADPQGSIEAGMHIDSVEPLNELTKAILMDCVVGIRGAGVDAVSDVSELVAELERLGLIHYLGSAAMQMQSLDAATPLFADPGHTQRDGSTESVPGSRDVVADVELPREDPELPVG